MTISTLLNLYIPKEDLGSKSLVILTCCVLVLWEPSLITLQLESISWDSSPTKTSNVLVATIPLSQEDIFSTSVWDLMGTGTQEEIHWAISLCSWLLILMLLHSQTINLLFAKLNLVYIFNFLLFPFLISHFSFFFLFSVLVLLLVCFSCT